MKVLWVCTSPIGPMAKALDETYQGSSGGWISAEYEKLKEDDAINVAFLTMKRSVHRGSILKKEYNDSSMYYIGEPNPTFGIEPPEWMTKNIGVVIDEFCPDLIQIWGTESVLSHAAAIYMTPIKKLIFLQGIIGIYVRYKQMWLQEEQRISVKHRLTDRLKNKLYRKQAVLEKRSLGQVQGVILDNDFSEGYCTSINSSLEIIRYPLLPQQEYYQHKWEDSACEAHSLFTVAGSSPMKGLHQLLQVVAHLKEQYHDIRLYVPGIFSISLRAMSGRISNEYEKMLYRIIKENHLEKNVVFTGKLSPKQMSEYMCRCSVFVNPSCMEVHALSLREAMTVGMPCVSTVCGSVAEFVRHGENGLLYRFAEPEVCESYLCRLFENRKERQRLSEHARNTWMKVDNGGLSTIYDTVHY